jgi:predicted phage tail protein
MSRDKKNKGVLTILGPAVPPISTPPVLDSIRARIEHRVAAKLLAEQVKTAQLAGEFKAATAEYLRQEARVRNIDQEIEHDREQLTAARQETRNRAETAAAAAKTIVEDHEAKRAEIAARKAEAEARTKRAELERQRLQEELDQRADPAGRRIRLEETVAKLQVEISELQAKSEPLLMRDNDEKAAAIRRTLEAQIELKNRRLAKILAELDDIP